MIRIMRVGKLITATLIFILAGLVTNPSSATATKPCAKMGAEKKVAGISVPACKVFYATKSAIRYPADSPRVKYGVVVAGESGPNTSAIFYDRKNEQMLFQSSLVPSALYNKKEAVQYIFQATLRKNKIVALKPVLFVPTRTMLKPFENSQFLGQINNLTPAAGINDSDWIRWNFNKIDVSSKLPGTFVNLKDSVRESQMREPPAPCAPALLSLEGDTKWYSNIFGSTDSISMYWDPGMHSRMNSEYVVSMSSGITYMSSAPSINMLLKKKVNIGAVAQWSIHGNPMETPYMFAKGSGLGYTPGFSTQTPVTGCSIN